MSSMVTCHFLTWCSKTAVLLGVPCKQEFPGLAVHIVRLSMVLNRYDRDSKSKWTEKMPCAERRSLNHPGARHSPVLKWTGTQRCRLWDQPPLASCDNEGSEEGTGQCVSPACLWRVPGCVPQGAKCRQFNIWLPPCPLSKEFKNCKDSAHLSVSSLTVTARLVGSGWFGKEVIVWMRSGRGLQNSCQNPEGSHRACWWHYIFQTGAKASLACFTRMA